MIQKENYQKAVEELQGILKRFRNYKVGGIDLEEAENRRERVYVRYRQPFEDIDNLSESDFHSFLSFKDGNEHWKEMERYKNKITQDIIKLRESLQFCLDGKIDDCMKDRPSGLGKATVTAFLLVATEGQRAVWNKISQKALELLQIWPLDSDKFNDENYNKFNAFMNDLARRLSVDLWIIDWLFWILVETSRKRNALAESYGATCKNPAWSWSFVNRDEKLVLFGAWDTCTSDNRSLILSKDWERTKAGRRQPGYDESVENIRLVKEEGYTLKIFIMEHSNRRKDEEGFGPAKIKGISPFLIEGTLEIEEDGWYVRHNEAELPPQTPPEEIPEDEESEYLEGGKKQIIVNAYERNPEAREKCIEHYGPTCRICGFNFGKTYGDKYKKFIHIHHIKPVSEMPDSYEVDPIKDLIPVCPNCHAVIHYGNKTLSIQAVKKLLKQ